MNDGGAQKDVPQGLSFDTGLAGPLANVTFGASHHSLHHTASTCQAHVPVGCGALRTPLETAAGGTI